MAENIFASNIQQLPDFIPEDSDNLYDSQTPAPTGSEYRSARLYESFPAVALRWWDTEEYDKNPDFEPLAEKEFQPGGRLERSKRIFGGAGSRKELDGMIRSYDESMKAKKTIMDYEQKKPGSAISRFGNYSAGFGIDLLSDPLTYVPVLGWWAKGAKASHRFMAAGSVGFAASVPYEYVRRQESMTRTNAESLIVMGAMFGLNGTVGAAFGKSTFRPASANLGGKVGPDDYEPVNFGSTVNDQPYVANPRRVEPEEVVRNENGESVSWRQRADNLDGVETGKPFTGTLWRSQTETPSIGPMSGSMGDDAQYWAVSKGQASSYGDDVIEAEITLQNPLVIRDASDIQEFFARTGKEMDVEQAEGMMAMSGAVSMADGSIGRMAKELGHDGIIINVWDNGQLVKRKGKTPGNGNFDQNEVVVFAKDRFHADETIGFEGTPKSAGAAAANVSIRDLERQESLRATRLGIENAPLNPLLRMLQGGAESSRLVQDLVEPAGMILNKVDDQIPMNNNSVSTMFKTTYLTPLFNAITKAEEAFLNYRGKHNNRSGVTANAFRMLREKVSTRAEGYGRNTDLYRMFNERVGLALMRGGDNMADEMTPFVNDAAKAYREVLDLVRREGTNVNLWVKEIDKKLAKLQERLETANPTTAAKISNQMDNLSAKRDVITQAGVQATIRSQGYFPRVYDIEYLLSDAGKAEWVRVVGGQIGRKPAEEAWTKITNSYDDTLEGFDSFIDDVAAGGAQARMLDVDDEILVPFLDFNTEAVIRDHVRRMGMDIELTRKFGSVDMADEIAAMPNASAKRDATAIRDLLRGVYGRPSDPYSMLNRGVSLLKNYSPLVYMGGAAVSSLPDIARPIMTEGLNAFFGTGLKALLSAQRKEIIKLNRQQIREVGEALDMTLSMRAFAMADTGSTFGRMSPLERSVKNIQVPFFLLNGLNIWTTVMKEFSGLIISNRMLKAVGKDWQTLPIADRDRLLANGIDGPMASRINSMMQVDGFFNQVGSFKFPVLGAWTDTGAADAFKRALNQQINRTIVTPNTGEKALWTEGHVGGMVAQFKSFGQSSTQRMLISGLQERNANFYIGAAAMTSLGMLVNEIKEIQYGYDKKRTWGQVLADGADRAGLFAILSDFNHALEVMTSNQMGLDALAGGEPMKPSVRKTISTFAGPGSATVYDFTRMATEALSGRAFEREFMNSMLRATPYQSHPLFPRGFYAVD